MKMLRRAPRRTPYFDVLRWQPKLGRPGPSSPQYSAFSHSGSHQKSRVSAAQRTSWRHGFGRIAWSGTFWFTTLGGLWLVTSLTRHYEVYRVFGRSMSPTLSPDSHDAGTHDMVLFKKKIRLEARGDVESEVRRGTVVSYWTPHDPERIAVKRVVAVAGDVVLPLRRAKLMSRASQADGCPRGFAVETAYPVTVPFGHVWVEGDNQEFSYDSNDFGPVSLSLITGKAIAIVMPWSRKRWVEASEEEHWKKRVKSRIRWCEGSSEIPKEWRMEAT